MVAKPDSRQSCRPGAKSSPTLAGSTPLPQRTSTTLTSRATEEHAASNAPPLRSSSAAAALGCLAEGDALARSGPLTCTRMPRTKSMTTKSNVATPETRAKSVQSVGVKPPPSCVKSPRAPRRGDFGTGNSEVADGEVGDGMGGSVGGGDAGAGGTPWPGRAMAACGAGIWATSTQNRASSRSVASSS